MSREFVAVRNLTFGYAKGGPILKDVSFNAEVGQVTSVLGPSGSGKSTLLKLIANIEVAPEASVVINGSNPEAYLGSGELAFMFQKPTLLDHLDVRQNITLPLQMLRRPIENSFVDELVEMVGLADHGSKYPSELSGGMQTRVALARAFITKPKLLLLDEPFSALDVGWKRLLYARLERLRVRFDATVLLVTHDIQEALLLSNHIYVLNSQGGRLDEVRLTMKLPRSFDIENGIAATQEAYKRIYNLMAIEGLRTNTLVSEARTTAKNLLTAIKSDTFSDSAVAYDQIAIRNHIDDIPVQQALKEAWSVGDDRVRMKLVWDMLLLNQSTSFHFEVAKSVVANLDGFNQNTNDFYGSQELLFSSLMQRINDPGIPKGKKWIYLCSMVGVAPNDQNAALEVVRSIGRKEAHWNGVMDLNIAGMVASELVSRMTPKP